MSAPTPATPSAPAFVRQSHDHDGDLAVFLIGMRVNQPWRPDLWMPVFGAMPGMLSELYAAKAAAARGEGADLGFLDGRSLLGAGGPTLVQYWRSVDDIYAYAERPAATSTARRCAAFYARSRRATRRRRHLARDLRRARGRPREPLRRDAADRSGQGVRGHLGRPTAAARAGCPRAG